jgi:hypothetical protein
VQNNTLGKDLWFGGVRIHSAKYLDLTCVEENTRQTSFPHGLLVCGASRKVAFFTEWCIFTHGKNICLVFAKYMRQSPLANAIFVKCSSPTVTHRNVSAVYVFAFAAYFWHTAKDLFPFSGWIQGATSAVISPSTKIKGIKEKEKGESQACSPSSSPV